MTSDGEERVLVRELEEANDAIRELRSENDRLYGLVSSLRGESRDLRQERTDLQDKLRIRDEEWLKEAQASPEWAGFRAGCLNHVAELKKLIDDLRRQVEAEREARTRGVWLDSRPDICLFVNEELKAQDERDREKAERQRKISLNRLRRAQRAEKLLAECRGQRHDDL
jgi:hypothetical protein